MSSRTNQSNVCNRTCGISELMWDMLQDGHPSALSLEYHNTAMRSLGRGKNVRETVIAMDRFRKGGGTVLDDKYTMETNGRGSKVEDSANEEEES